MIIKRSVSKAHFSKVTLSNNVNCECSFRKLLKKTLKPREQNLLPHFIKVHHTPLLSLYINLILTLTCTILSKCLRRSMPKI